MSDFKCKWFDIFDRMIFIKHDLDSELYSIDICREMLAFDIEPFVPQDHYEQVFFHLDVSNKIWWFVIPCTLGGKMDFENVYVAIVALGPEVDVVNVSGELNVGDQVEL
jgi:hypothetical protein